MYAIKSGGKVVGYSDTVVYVRLHENGSYVPCAESEAHGFCAKMARELTMEDDESITGMVDTVYCFIGKVMHGDEPIGSFEQINGAAQLMNSENVVTTLVGQNITPRRAVALRQMIEAAATSLPDGEAASVPELITAWEYPVAYAEGDRRSYGGKVYKCRQGHTSQADWTPDKTPNLWAVIDAEHAGTQADPIPAARGMEYEYGKYYLDGEDGKTYKCERIGESAGGKIVLQYLPHELVGNYFTAV